MCAMLKSKYAEIRLHIRPGPDLVGYDNMTRFWLGSDMISGAAL